MKKFFLLVMTAAAVLFASSCSKEQLSTVTPVGEQVTVTLTADLGAIGSRAIADGLKVNEVAWAIYLEGEDTPLTDMQGVLPINDKQGTLEVRLVTGRSYDIALFAYSTENPTASQALTMNGAVTAPSYYSVDWNNKQVSVLYPDGTIANDTDKRDCFWHVEKSLKVTAPVNKTFTLTRPLAQLNFGSSEEDTVAAENAGLVVAKSKIVASTYTKFNLFTGECLDSQVVEYTFAKNVVPSQPLNVQGVDYNYLGTVYLLVDSQMTQDVSMTVYDEADQEINTVSYSYAPLQRNYRTNILGYLLTDPAKFTIIVDESFLEPDNNVIHWNGETKAITPDAEGVYNVTEAAELAWIASQVNSGSNDFSGKSVVIPASVGAIDLNSSNNQIWTPIGTSDKPFKGSFDGNGVVIRNVLIKTTECAGLFGNVVGSIANVNLQDVTIEAGHYAGAVAGYAYADITGCTVNGLTMFVTPYQTTRAAYDNGDKVGGIVGYVGEKSGTAGYAINNNTVTKATIVAYRDLGGIAGAAYVAECKGNTVKDCSLTVDQEVNNYGTKDANLGKIVGRVLSGSVDEDLNTIDNVTLTWNPYSLRPCIENVIAAGAKSGVTAKGYVLATSADSFLLADETGWIMVFRPKNYSTAMPAEGDVVSVTGTTSLYPTAKPNMLQFAANAVVTVLDEPKVEVTHPTSDVWTVEQIEAYAKAPIRTFGTLKGKLNVNGNYYNIEIEGTKKQGSILAPKADIKSLISNNGLHGKTIQVSGYLTYTTSSSTYLNMMITDFVDCKVATEWGVVGDMTSWGSTPDITMYTYGDGVMFAKGVSIAEGQGFKIRANNEWNDAKNYGTADPKVYINMALPVYSDGGSGNIIPVEGGKFDIYFDLNKKLVFVMEVGEAMEDALEYEKFEEPIHHKDTWRIVGAFNGWNAADDNYLMTLTDDNKWATITASFAEDTQLKFVANGNWDKNFGNGVTVELNKEYAGYQGGDNINVPAGSYKISLSMCDGRFKFESAVTEVTKTITFDNTSKRTVFNNNQQVWVENGITVTNDKSASTNNVANYYKPARFYQSSKLTFTAGGEIVKIVFDCNSSSYATALKNSLGSSLGTVSISSDKVTLELTTPTAAVVVAKLTAQVRMDAMTVTWLE